MKRWISHLQMWFFYWNNGYKLLARASWEYLWSKKARDRFSDIEEWHRLHPDE
jgi:hypothetical protein